MTHFWCLVSVFLIVYFLNLLFSPVCLRMRSVVLLSLLFFLALSDGANRQNNKRYAEFKKKHILPTDFQTDVKAAWVDHLRNNHLCGRTEVQSFIKDTEENIKQICNGAGKNTTDNYYKSTNLFQVYNIESKNISTDASEWECIIEKCRTAKFYIIVDCQNKLPVHYHDQHIERNKSAYPCYYTAWFNFITVGVKD